MAYLTLDKETGATVLCPGRKPRMVRPSQKKMRTKDNPYEIWRSNDGSGWEWRVLKKWQNDDSKPYARWFCAVKSPFTYGGYELGDCYVSDIKSNATKVFQSELP